MNELMNGAGATGNNAKKILVVDDEKWCVEATIEVLRDFGYEVHFADTVDAATQMLRKHEFDAVLLDVMLPQSQARDLKNDRPMAERGFTLARTIQNGGFRATDCSRSPLIFAFTAIGAEVPEFLNKLREMNIEYFGKPLRSIQVAETLRMSLET